MKILIDDSKVKPLAVNTPARIPLAWEKKVKDDIDHNVRLGVIEKVPDNTPQTYCARMHVVAKHNGKPRRVVDFTGLNRISIWQTHVTTKPFDLACKIPDKCIMSQFDCWNGYHSVPVAESDIHFLQFITPWGRYRYRKAPQGYISSGDVYNYKTEKILVDVPNHLKIVNNSLIYATVICSRKRSTSSHCVVNMA